MLLFYIFYNSYKACIRLQIENCELKIEIQLDNFNFNPFLIG